MLAFGAQTQKVQMTLRIADPFPTFYTSISISDSKAAPH